MEYINEFDDDIKNETSSSVEIVNNHRRRHGGIEVLEVASSIAEDDSINDSKNSVTEASIKNEEGFTEYAFQQSQRRRNKPASEDDFDDMVEQIRTARERERRRIFYMALGPGRKKKKKSKKRIDVTPSITKNITSDIERKHPLLEDNVTAINSSYMAVVKEVEEYADHPMYDKEKWTTNDLSPYRYKEVVNDVVQVIQRLPKRCRDDLIVRKNVINQVLLQDPSTADPKLLINNILQQVKEVLQNAADPEELALREQQLPMSDDEMLDRFCVQCNTFDCPLHSPHQTTDGKLLEVDSKILIPIAIKYNEYEQRKRRAEIKKGRMPSRTRKGPFDHLPFADIVPIGQGGAMKQCQLSDDDKATLGRLQGTIFLGHYGMMNGATGGRYCHELTSLPKPPPVTPLRPEDLNKEMNRTITDPKMKKRIGTAAQKKPYFFPCFHSGPCTKENGCTCIKYNFLCTEQCVNGRYGHNFFRGCGCTAGCTESKFCPCVMGHRECNPQVCSCTCKRCQNRYLFRNSKGAQLFIAESTIEGTGFGVFTKHDIQEGEYVGEVRCPDFLFRSFGKTLHV
jgi:hypothetical protein